MMGVVWPILLPLDYEEPVPIQALTGQKLEVEGEGLQAMLNMGRLYKLPYYVNDINV